LIFTRIDSKGVARLWMISLFGGALVGVTSQKSGWEQACAWSLDGSRLLYGCLNSGKGSLMTVRTSGNATPVELKNDVVGLLTAWLSGCRLDRAIRAAPE
jgi:hypothetical protein